MCLHCMVVRFDLESETVRNTFDIPCANLLCYVHLPSCFSISGGNGVTLGLVYSQ